MFCYKFTENDTYKCGDIFYTGDSISLILKSGRICNYKSEIVLIKRGLVCPGYKILTYGENYRKASS